MSTGFHIFIGVLMFGAGYAASVFTWDKIRSTFVTVETEIATLQARIRALRGNP